MRLAKDEDQFEENGFKTRVISLISRICFDMMVRAETGIRAPASARLATTHFLDEREHAMTAYQDITPTTQILDDAGRDWAWAFVVFGTLPEYPGYCVGSNGSVWSRWIPGWNRRIGRTDSGQIRMSPQFKRLKSWSNKNGYIFACLRKNNNNKFFTLNRLVLSTFIPNPRPGYDACHNNGQKSDNSIYNLRWDTRAGNMSDTRRHGTKLFGERISVAKLTEADVREIRERACSVSQDELARIFGVDQSAISRVVRSKNWSHVPTRKGMLYRGNSSSGFVGVRKCGGKWQASISINKKHLSIGFFDTAMEAALARDRVARLNFGDRARLNFPHADGTEARP